MTVKVGIAGVTGYTGGELIRLLMNHPEAKIVAASSRSNVGNPVSAVISAEDITGCNEHEFACLRIKNT